MRRGPPASVVRASHVMGAGFDLRWRVRLGVDGEGGLFAAGSKKWREYVKHPIDRCSPRRPEAADEECGITMLEQTSVLCIRWKRVSMQEVEQETLKDREQRFL